MLSERASRWIERTLQILVVVLALSPLVPFAWQIGLIPHTGEICKYNQYKDEEKCATHHVVKVLIFEAGKFLDDISVAVTAGATIAVAAFTWTLWRSTDKMWKLGGYQLQLARDEFNATHRPRMRIKFVRLVEPIEAGKPIMVQLVSVNYGDTNATVVHWGLITHPVVVGRHFPSNPFANAPQYPSNMRLPSGVHLDHLPQPAGSVTGEELKGILADSTRLYFFAYVDYLDNANTFRQTGCCRVFRASVGTDPHRVEGEIVPVGYATDHEFQD